MPDLEAIGDAVTGGMMAHAVEPKSGAVADGHTQESACLNCGAPLSGPYCHKCGQHAHVHRTLGAFWHDLVHGVLHFEGKFWHTLPLLSWKPGELTRRYIDGQRARFISPIALFLFSVFLMFAVMSLTGGLDTMAKQAAQDDLQGEIADSREKIADLQEERGQAIKEGDPTAKLDERLSDARAELATKEAVAAARTGKAQPIDADLPKGTPEWIDQAFGKARENPELLFYKLKTNAYKLSWALIPISVPFVWLLFPFSRRFRLYDHTVFVTYSLCFMMLLLTVASSVGLLLPIVASLAWFIPPVHMYRQLRGTYGVGRLGAFLRTLALTLFAFIAIGLFTSLLVALGALD